MNGTRTVLAAVVLLLAAGCGGGSTSAGSSQDGVYGPAPSSTPAPSTSAAAGSDGGAVSVASTSLGEVLVGPSGLTLYLYDPDKQGSSTCYAQCASTWPPLTTSGAATAGSGVDASLLGVVARTDGTEQVTYDKWPLYYFAKDAKPGDATGQGVGGVWWVVDAKGQPVR
jgi:predicted lipoprotein with Yx(FWY)xxD motif